MMSLRQILRRHYLLLALGPIALAGMLLGAYFMFLSLNSTLDVESLRAGQTALRLDDALARISDSLRDQQVRESFMSVPAKERRDVLRTFMASHPLIRELTLICPKGHEILHLSDYLPDHIDSDEIWHGRPEFEEPMQNGITYVSGVSIHPDSGAPSLTISYPLLDPGSGKPNCVAVLQLRLSELIGVIAGYSLLPGETLYLVDDSGMIVVHPDTSLVLARTVVSPGGFMGLATIPGSKSPCVRTMRPLELGAHTFRVVADRALYKALGPALNGATLLLALLCSAAGLAFILAAKSREVIEQPLSRLTATARAIGDGDITRRAAAGGYLEADILARAFNEMTDRLEHAREVLELEMTARAQAQHDLERSQALLALHLDTTPMGCIFFDLKGRITTWNPAAVKIFGWSRDEALGRLGADILLLPEDTERMGKVFQEIMEHGRAIVVNRNRTKDDRMIVCEWHSSCLTVDGEVVGVASLVMDVTGRLAAERSLRASLREKETLLQEVHHRVKNNMQVISSLLNLQIEKDTDPHFKEMISESIARIRSMALVHEQLYRAQSLSELDLAGYLETLVGKLAATMGESGRFTAEAQSEPIGLGINQAIPLGLIVNELVINAFKHAFVGREKGHVSVLARDEGSDISLTVEDDGIGLPPGFNPEHALGLGWQIVTGLTAQIRGQIEIESVQEGKGTVLRLTFPLQAGHESHLTTASSDFDAEPTILQLGNDEDH